VLFPLVALAISSVVEGYRWSAPALAGLGLEQGRQVVLVHPASLGQIGARLQGRASNRVQAASARGDGRGGDRRNTSTLPAITSPRPASAGALQR
jgi:hypothetical protein